MNRPKTPIRNYNQDSVVSMKNSWKKPTNYEPYFDMSSHEEDNLYLYSTRRMCAKYVQGSIQNTRYFEQVGLLFRSSSKRDGNNQVKNLAFDLKQVKMDDVLHTTYAHFYKAGCRHGYYVSKVVGCAFNKVQWISNTIYH